MKVIAKVPIAFLGILLTVASFPGCTPPQKIDYGFEPRLSFSEAPALGKAVEISLSFESPRITSGSEVIDTYYTARLLLPPEGFEVIQGDTVMSGKNTPGESHILKTTVKAAETMDTAVYGEVTLRLSENGTPEGSDETYAYVKVTQEGARVSNSLPSGAASIGCVKPTH